MRKTIIIGGVAACSICAALIFGVIFTQRAATPSQDLTLSDYPKMFAKVVVIVIGENASQQTLGTFDQNASQIESAEAIAANLKIFNASSNSDKNLKRKIRK